MMVLLSNKYKEFQPDKLLTSNDIFFDNNSVRVL